jgi:hypothetical protein
MPTLYIKQLKQHTPKGNSWKWGSKLYDQVRKLSPIYIALIYFSNLHTHFKYVLTNFVTRLNMLHLLFYVELCPFVSLVFDTHAHTFSYSSLILDIHKHVYALEINDIFCNLNEMIYRKSI